jgi:hypothetical protein
MNWKKFFNKENLNVGWSLAWRVWLVNILFGGLDRAIESDMKGPDPLFPLAGLILTLVLFVFGVVILISVLDRAAKKIAKERYSLTITKHVGFRILIIFIFVIIGFMVPILLIEVLISSAFGGIVTIVARAAMLLAFLLGQIYALGFAANQVFKKGLESKTSRPRTGWNRNIGRIAMLFLMWTPIALSGIANLHEGLGYGVGRPWDSAWAWLIGIAFLIVGSVVWIGIVKWVTHWLGLSAKEAT